MAATESSMMPIGTIAPAFSLPDTQSGTTLSLQQLAGEKATVVMFICNHCPYVIHIKPQLIDIATHYRELGISFIAISSNDIENYPQDAPDKMTQLMNDWDNPFAAYLYDESQDVARAYQAACTPDLYVFDPQLSCVYRGRLDNSTPKNGLPLTGIDLRSALNHVLKQEPVTSEQFPSIGCNIKWKNN